jgi:hypothetical protein
MACNGTFGFPGLRDSFGRDLSLYICLSFWFVLIRDLVDQQIFSAFFFRFSGKTSLLQAEVTPRLREQGNEPVLIRLSFHEGSPSCRSQVLMSLAHALELAGRTCGANFSDHVPLWEIFHDSVYGLVKPTGDITNMSAHTGTMQLRTTGL